jgi:glycerol-3-phosphate dehydrogenase
MTTTTLDAARRARDLEALASGTTVDVLVAGGGITGVGVALDAATRGLSVALLERGDLAQGTSRWSSKLAHGGLRYLAKGDVGVAWESASERAVLIDRTAPHLARAVPMLIPLNDDLRAFLGGATEIGLRLGDALRAAAGTSPRRLPRARRIEAAEALRWAPALKAEGLRGALLNWDAQLEDDARLVVAIARTAAAHGARIVTHAGVERLHAGGATARDSLSGATFEVRARHVVNATGVWAQALAPGVALRPSKGSHLLVPAGRLGDPQASLHVPVPGAYGRWVFALPRPDAPPVSDAEEAFMLGVIGRALDRPLTPADVVGRFAGLRPLLDLAPGEADGERGATADVSRRHAVLEDPDSGAVTVVGGKLTTYRRMAQDAVDVIARRPGVAAGPCRTRRLPVVGAQGPHVRPAGIPQRLVRRYGAEAGAVLAIGDDRPELLAPVAPGVPVLGVELAWAVEREGACTLDDVLDRRTRIGLVDAWREAAEPAAAAILDGLLVA